MHNVGVVVVAIPVSLDRFSESDLRYFKDRIVGSVYHKGIEISFGSCLPMSARLYCELLGVLPFLFQENLTNSLLLVSHGGRIVFGSYLQCSAMIEPTPRVFLIVTEERPG